MKLNEVKFGSDHTYLHKPTGKKCEVVCCHADDGAYLVIEFYDDDQGCGTGVLLYSEACELEAL